MASSSASLSQGTTATLSMCVQQPGHIHTTAWHSSPPHPMVLFSFFLSFFTVQMLSPFLVFLLQTPPSYPPPPAFIRVFLLPPYHPGIPLHWGIKPSQDQGPALSLMPDKAPFSPFSPSPNSSTGVPKQFLKCHNHLRPIRFLKKPDI